MTIQIDLDTTFGLPSYPWKVVDHPLTKRLYEDDKLRAYYMLDEYVGPPYELEIRPLKTQYDRKPDGQKWLVLNDSSMLKSSYIMESAQLYLEKYTAIKNEEVFTISCFDETSCIFSCSGVCGMESLTKMLQMLYTTYPDAKLTGKYVAMLEAMHEG